jgi:Holliday junction resolvase RusA-like endonuclease
MPPIRTRKPRPKAPDVERVPPGAIICRFAVPGRAVPWKPARITSRGSYKPRVVRDWQEAVALHCRMAMVGRKPYGGPVRVVVDIVHTSGIVGDFDNLGKAILDATQGIAILNDKQILSATITKLRGDADGVNLTYYAMNANGEG